MTSLHIPIIGGTGLFRDSWTGPIHPGERYYEPLRRVAAELTENAHIITLYRAGIFASPKKRSERAALVIERKLKALANALGIYVGHSQGGVEAMASGLRNHQRVRAILTYSGVLGGTPLARYCMFPIPGVLGMRPASGNLQQLLWQQQVLAHRYRQERIEFLPELHLISSHHDGLVSCQSAHTVHPDYPNVYHYCMSSDPDHRCHPDAMIIPTNRWDSHHVNMVRTKPGLDLAATILAGVQARLEHAA